MPLSALSRDEHDAAGVNHAYNERATFAMEDVRALVHDDPSLLYVASGYAKRFNPATTLARAA